MDINFIRNRIFWNTNNILLHNSQLRFSWF